MSKSNWSTCSIEFQDKYTEEHWIRKIFRLKYGTGITWIDRKTSIIDSCVLFRYWYPRKPQMFCHYTVVVLYINNYYSFFSNHSNMLQDEHLHLFEYTTLYSPLSYCNRQAAIVQCAMIGVMGYCKYRPLLGCWRYPYHERPFYHKWKSLTALSRSLHLGLEHLSNGAHRFCTQQFFHLFYNSIILLSGQQVLSNNGLTNKFKNKIFLFQYKAWMDQFTSRVDYVSSP